MAWTPKLAGATGGEDRVGSSPSTIRRRRKSAALEEAETPNVRAAREASPRKATGARQPAGKRKAAADREEGDVTSVRIQLGNRWSNIVTQVARGDYTWQEFVDGLDEQELARCQLRADNGTFVGGPPKFVPREFALAAQREQKRRFEEIFGSEVLGLAQSYVDLCKDLDIPAKDRAKMMQYAMERVFGGIPKDVRVTQEQPWEHMVMNVVTEDETGMPEHLRRRYEGYAARLGDTSPPSEDGA
jgi:hypothetical protein